MLNLSDILRKIMIQAYIVLSQSFLIMQWLNLFLYRTNEHIQLLLLGQYIYYGSINDCSRVSTLSELPGPPLESPS